MAHCYQTSFSPEDIAQAIEIGTRYYREHFDELCDDDNLPKTPAYLTIALATYAAERVPNDRFEVLEVGGNKLIEASGLVPIDSEGRNIHFRLDLMCRDLDNKELFVADYKTTKYNTVVWAESFQTSIQVSLYLHAASMIFDQHPVTMVINGFILHKNEVITRRIPITKTNEQLEMALFDANCAVDDIETDMTCLAQCSPDDPILCAFPRRTNSCSEFNRLCPFHEFCINWPNPLAKCDVVQPGFVIDHWDPRKGAGHTIDIVETAKELKK